MGTTVWAIRSSSLWWKTECFVDSGWELIINYSFAKFHLVNLQCYAINHLIHIINVKNIIGTQIWQIYADVYANNNAHDGAIIDKSCDSIY